MRLFEAILQANHRALNGDNQAGVRPAEFPEALPVVALTCIDPRLNRLLPEVLGVREEDFIWLRNAGNIVFDPLSGMLRTLALACAVKGGKEVAVIGHTDCRVGQVSVNQLIEKFRALGIDRARLPDNLVEFFGLFASERQNVINGVEHIRRSPLISATVPVHGLMLDIQTGHLDWLVNGYDELGKSVSMIPPLAEKFERVKAFVRATEQRVDDLVHAAEAKIGSLSPESQQWLSEVRVLREAKHEPPPPPASPPRVAHRPASAPPPLSRSIPIPPPISVKIPPRPNK